MANRANITPEVFKWARTTAKLTEESAARKVNVPVERLIEWEEGLSKPTMNQARILAKAYRRPFAMFFLPSIPYDFTPLQDFRRKSAKPLGTASVFMIREVQQKQAWISELFEDMEETPLDFVGRYSIEDDPRAVAEDITTSLKISPPYYSKTPLKAWIEASEEAGVFVSRASAIHAHLKLDTEELQGFAIADPYAPFVFVNSRDYDAPQLFTLVHELAHIWIAETGISNEAQAPFSEQRSNYHPVELFCNKVAANALLPADFMSTLSEAVFESADNAYQIARRLGVSTKAFIIRALNLSLVSHTRYNLLSDQAHERYRAFLEEEQRKRQQQKDSSPPIYYTLQINKNGRRFINTVLSAYREGEIEGTFASDLLNVKINKFDALEQKMI